MILGMPWLEKTNPMIDWVSKTVEPRPLPPISTDLRSVSKDPISQSPVKPQSSVQPPSKPPSVEDSSDICDVSPSLDLPTFRRRHPHPHRHRLPAILPTKNINPKRDELLLFSIVDVTDLKAAAEAQVNLLSASASAETTLPPEYAEYADVFEEKNSEVLPPHRPNVDHEIPLVPGAKPVYGPIYNLSETELKVLREYIDKMLAKGFIRPSKSPFGSPILFVKKPDGSLRLCVDYRKLNQLTIKNRYPLPLISELFDRIKNAKRFTRLDMQDAYNQLRVAEGDEWKTAFRTRYGHFEYLVMPFGLTNAPASFQTYTNDCLHDFLDFFCVVYLDDVLIFSDTPEEHVNHVKQVLSRLREYGLTCNLKKCEFHATSLSFLGFVISSEGVSMDPDRIVAINEWPTPMDVHEIQIFLGFANFYRRFIEGYSRIAAPITGLLKKTSHKQFRWTPEAQAAFDELKHRFTTAPILKHFDPDRPICIHTDASGFAISGIISQLHGSTWHPIAFFSRKCIPAECNYGIPDLEMLAIVECMRHWRHYLEGSRHTIQVLSDHKNLTTFMSTKVLNRRQARWAELLASYDFILMHTAGKRNPADGPSRRPDYATGNELPHGTLIPPNALRSAEVTVVTVPLHDQIIAAYKSDDVARHRTDAKSLQSPWSYDDAGLLLHKGLIYVPQSMRMSVLKDHHDAPLAGHCGVARTIELLSRNYWFPGMQSFVKNYVNSCFLCQQAKPSRHLHHGELASLPVPTSPWKGLSCDLITDLPISNGYDSILVFVDRMSKMSHFIPCTKTMSAPDFAKLFVSQIVRLHGLPDSIVSDHGSIFTSNFWSTLASILKIDPHKSTAFHPQTDGQTERMNQTLEQYLRIHCNYQQDDWFDLLPLAEFAYNNATQESTKMSPFYANYGYHPRFLSEIQLSPDHGSGSQPSSVHSAPAAEDFALQLNEIHERLVENVKKAQDYQAKYYNAKHKPLELQPGDMVWLNSANISTSRPSKKLDWKRLGPFQIAKRVGLQAYKLALPPTMRNIHDTFHVSLLDPVKSTSIAPHSLPPPPPPLYIKDDQQYFEIENILDSKRMGRRLHYLVKWKGYPDSENSWEPLAFIPHGLIKEFHRRHPGRPGEPRRVHFVGLIV